MTIQDIVEQICRLDDNQMLELAQECMAKRVAVPLEFSLHTAQLDADIEETECEI